jgi:peptide subunit release factor 1 (eRF1)
MVFDARFRAMGWRCPKCCSLGSGGSPRACPYCQGEICSADLREEIVSKAKSRGVELFFTENFSPLMKAGGIAALLKYETPKRMKR